jgi:hypothetical protein
MRPEVAGRALRSCADPNLAGYSPQPRKGAGLGDVSGGSRADIDDLADRLIEKRERLHYFIVTASAAVLLFSLGLLKQPHHRVGGCAKVATVFGGILLLLAAGTALGGILYRHRIYSQYLDELQGLRQSTEAADQKTRRRFLWIEGSMILLFFSGFVILAVVDGILLLWP